MILAGGVGRAVEDAAVGKIDLDRPARDGRSILVARDQIGLDRLAAIKHGLLQVEGQVDRLELIRLDLETAGEVALSRLIDPDPIRRPQAPPSRARAIRETCRIPKA